MPPGRKREAAAPVNAPASPPRQARGQPCLHARMERRCPPGRHGTPGRAAPLRASASPAQHTARVRASEAAAGPPAMRKAAHAQGGRSRAEAVLCGRAARRARTGLCAAFPDLPPAPDLHKHRTMDLAPALGTTTDTHRPHCASQCGLSPLAEHHARCGALRNHRLSRGGQCRRGRMVAGRRASADGHPTCLPRSPRGPQPHPATRRDRATSRLPSGNAVHRKTAPGQACRAGARSSSLTPRVPGATPRRRDPARAPAARPAIPQARSGAHASPSLPKTHSQEAP